ncbi:MAG: hypothetical protein EBZ48_03785 [Proteobacteria bacterium]|nr:hypothetical protein [Pseudomonadota bacterium]
MGKGSGDGKIGGIKSSVVKPTDTAREISKAETVSEVGEVSGVQATTGIGGAAQAGGVGRRRPTRTMSLEEREQLFKMVNEEADKIFAQTGMSDSRKRSVTEAVKMAIDSGLMPDDAGTSPRKK